MRDRLTSFCTHQARSDEHPFSAFLICEFSDFLFGLDILFTKDKDAFEITVIYKVVVDEILIINEHIKVVDGFAIGPDNTISSAIAWAIEDFPAPLLP